MDLDLHQFINSQCSAKLCGARAVVLPALLLFADQKSKPAKMKLAHPICRKCAQNLTLDKILVAPLWSQITSAIQDAKLPPPVKALTKLAFVVIPPDPKIQQQRRK